MLARRHGKGSSGSGWAQFWAPTQNRRSGDTPSRTCNQLVRQQHKAGEKAFVDWAMAPLSETERRDFWEICEDRYQTRSMILTSQLPVARWHEQVGDPTVADGIRDRLVHNAHRIEMKGDSMRKKRGGGA